MPTSNIITQLTKEHREVAEIFSEIEKTTERSGKKRQELFAKLDKALSAHAEFEEARVYPLLEEKKASKPTALEAVEEHLQIKRLLEELRDLQPQDEVWSAKITVLMENTSHHVKEEENEVFNQLKKIVSSSDLVKLGEEYETTKMSDQSPKVKDDEESGDDLDERSNNDSRQQATKETEPKPSEQPERRRGRSTVEV